MVATEDSDRDQVDRNYANDVKNGDKFTRMMKVILTMTLIND